MKPIFLIFFINVITSCAQIEVTPKGEVTAETFAFGSFHQKFVATLEFVQDGQNQTSLTLVNTQKKTKNEIILQDLIQGRTIIGLYPHSSQPQNVFVLSQLQKAGADFPRMDLYDSIADKWTSLIEEIDCVNYQNIEIIKGSLKMNCLDDAIHPPKKSKIKLHLKGISPPRS